MRRGIEPGGYDAFRQRGLQLWKTAKIFRGYRGVFSRITTKPDFAAGWGNIGLFRFHQHHYSDAVLAAEKALAIDPDYAEPYVIIGMVRKESGDLDGAISAFKRAAELNPSFMEAHANLGAAYLDCEQIDAAVREVQWAIQLRPEEPWLHRTLALAHWKRRNAMAAAGDLCRATYLYVRRELKSPLHSSWPCAGHLSVIA